MTATLTANEDIVAPSAFTCTAGGVGSLVFSVTGVSGGAEYEATLPAVTALTSNGELVCAAVYTDLVGGVGVSVLGAGNCSMTIGEWIGIGNDALRLIECVCLSLCVCVCVCNTACLHEKINPDETKHKQYRLKKVV